VNSACDCDSDSSPPSSSPSSSSSSWWLDDGPDDKWPKMFGDGVWPALGVSNTDLLPPFESVGLPTPELKSPGVEVPLTGLEKPGNNLGAEVALPASFGTVEPEIF